MTAKDLKASILQLAIQGKLVPQDPTDEPASVLLARIRDSRVEAANGRATSMKSPRGRGTRPASPPITDDEKPFDIPEGWAWCRLGEVADVLAGYPFEGKGYSKEGVKICGGLIIMPNEIKWQECKRWPTDEGLEDFLLSEGDIVVALDRPWISDGAKVGLIRSQDLPCLLIQRTARIRSKVVLPAYLMLMLKLPMLKQHCNITEMTVPHISHKDIETYSIPLPPLAEQKRIVAKIEELIPMVERYGAVKEQSDALEAALPDAFRKSVLQYAIQGKLVPQDPNDEPASALLAKLSARKEALIKAKKVRKDKPLDCISEDDVPFDIPEGWMWTRLGNLAYKFTDGTHRTPKYSESGVPFISVKNMSAGVLDFSCTKFITQQEHEEIYPRCNPEKGDLLISKVGTTGVPAIVDVDFQFSLFVSVALMKFDQKLLCGKFLYYMICSPLIQEQVQENTRGVGNKNWVIDDARATLFPLPPLAEQKRIVAEVERLLALGERLKVAKT